MKKIIIYIFAVYIIFGIGLSSSSAQEPPVQFETNYNITYEPQISGATQVTQNIAIVNKQSDLIATNYSLTIKQMVIYDVQASNSNGSLDYKVETKDGVTTVKVTFTKEIIGEGRQNKFTIKYKSNDIATKIGDVWNVSFPKVQTPATTQEYNVSLSIPDEFGPEIFVSPSPASVTKEAKNTLYSFTKDTVTDRSISASFGKYQTFNFALKYELANNSILSSYQEIPLPSDIKDHQQVSYKDIKPSPTSLKLDGDGNVIALYKLDGNQKLTIMVLGTARILGRQVKSGFGGAFDQIPTNLKDNYTGEGKYWEVNDKKIKDLAKTLYNANETVSQNAQRIYDYVVKNLKYDFKLVKKDFIQRNGALAALTVRGQWACMEFTDAFIALARANGIPARELNGYTFSSDKNILPLSIDLKGGDLLHAWPEYYDPNFGWVEIDPTWGTTSGIDYFSKLDTNHFAFVVKGLSSEYPLPAGAYRFKDSNEKLISVDIAQEINPDDFSEKLFLYKAPTYNPIKLLEGKQRFLLSNEGAITVYNVSGSKDPLIPGQTTSIYLPKNSYSVTYDDFNNVTKTKKPEIKEGWPKNYSDQTILWVLGGVLGLCMIVFLLQVRPEFLRTLFSRLTHRLRDLNR